MTTHYWQLRETEYLDTKLCREGSSSIFRPPNDWSLSTCPIDSTYVPLAIIAGRPITRSPDFFYHNVLPFVSDRCKLILENCRGYSGEFHRASLVTHTGADVDANPYWYFRLFDNVNAINRQESEIEFFPGSDRPKRVWRLELIESELRGHQVFRLNKIEAIFISDAVKCAMESGDLNVRFSPAEEFRLGW